MFFVVQVMLALTLQATLNKVQIYSTQGYNFLGPYVFI